MNRLLPAAVFLVGTTALAQPAHQLAVQVVNAAAHPPRVVSGVRVSLVRTIAGTPVTAGVAPSDRNGRVVFDVPRSFLFAYDVRVELADEGDLVIYDPPGGEVSAGDLHARNLLLKLLPRGSPSLLEPVQLEALIARLSSTEPRAPAREDLTRTLRQWARQAGFTPDEVQAQLRQWVETTRKSSSGASRRQRALAEFADSNFLAAAALFGEAADLDEAELERSIRARKEADEAERAMLVQFVVTRFRQAVSFGRALRHDEARKTIEAALSRIDRSRHRDLWIDVMLNRATARRQDAEARPSARESEPLFHAALADYQELLKEVAGGSDPRDRYVAAVVRRDLAAALVTQGSRLENARAVPLFEQATATFRDVLHVLTRSDYPKLWAETQTNIGIVLRLRAGRSARDPDAMQLLLESAQASRAALQVLTGPEFGRERALAQEGLAMTLREQSWRSDIEGASALLREAVDLLRAALKVYDRTTTPDDWARAQNILANVLQGLAERSAAPESVALLTEAVEAHRANLQVTTRANVPYDWAIAQTALGLTFYDLAERSTGATADTYIGRAEEAFRASAEVFTRENMPLYWAGLQRKIARTFHFRARRTALPDAAAAHRVAALDAFTAAAALLRKEVDPFEWALIRSDVGDLLSEHASDARGGAEVRTWAEAMTAYEDALQVFTRSHWPVQWAMVQSRRGLALLRHADRVDEAERRDCLSEALAAYESALPILTRSRSGRHYLEIHFGLSLVHLRMKNWEPAAASAEAGLAIVPDYGPALEIAEQIYQDELFLFERALELNERRMKNDPTPSVRIELGEKLLTTSRFHDCVAHWGALKAEGVLSDGEAMVMESLLMACAFGARDFRAAASSARALLRMEDAVENPQYRFSGPRRFVSMHGAFASTSAAWRQLFESIEAGDGTRMSAAVRQIQIVLGN